MPLDQWRRLFTRSPGLKSTLCHLILLLAISTLCWNLYFQPLQSLCASNHRHIITELKSRNWCTKLKTTIKHPHIPKTNNSVCKFFNTLIKEIHTIKLCKNINYIYLLQNSRFHDFIEHIISLTKMSLEESNSLYRITSIIKNSTPLNVIKLIDFIRSDLKLDTNLTAPNWASSDVAKKMFLVKVDHEAYYRDFNKSFGEIGIVHNTMERDNPYIRDKIRVKELKKILDNRDEKREAIYFTETTGTGRIKGRFVCAVESAARAYPNADIYLLVAYIPPEGLKINVNEPLHNVLKAHGNVQVLEIDLKALFMGSPLEPFYRAEKLKTSQFLAAHTSDMVRMLVVWMYGGKYFDLDIVTMKNLTGIDAFIIHETNFTGTTAANGAFAFPKFHPIGPIMFDMLNKRFIGSDWGGNGPGVFTGALGIYTGINMVDKMNDSNLKGFKKLRYGTLFPIEHNELIMYFREDRTEEALKRIRDSEGVWGLHIGNNIAQNDVVWVGSNQAYSVIAQRYCPRSYWSCDMRF